MVDSEFPHLRIAIVGTGFAGLGLAIRLRDAGIEDFLVFDRAEEIGGTWQVNTYPGCQCDVPSHLYSLSFAPNPSWTRTYSRQPEIWDYLRRLTEQHGLRAHLRLGHELTGAAWDDDAQRWRIETSRGALSAQILVDATGGLSQPAAPRIRGLRRFEGTIFHSAAWNHDHDLAGERVAVIGTGASAIQFVPQIQPKVARMHVFQRTAPWVMPHSDRRIHSWERALFRALPFTQRAIRVGVYWLREITLAIGMTRNPKLLRPLERVGRLHLRRAVRDPELRRRLEPDFRLGCKRILVSNAWYPALARDNVELVTDAITEIRAHSVVTADGREREVDTIILGTGFHVTDPPTAALIRGRDGKSLAEMALQGGIQAYLGTTLAGVPNLFKMTGPNTGLGHSSMVFMIESQLEYVLDALRVMDERGLSSVEVRPEAQASFNAFVQERMPSTVWASGCSSWYLLADGSNRVLWPDFTFRYRQRMRRFDAHRYELRTRAPQAVTA